MFSLNVLKINFKEKKNINSLSQILGLVLIISPNILTKYM